MEKILLKSWQELSLIINETYRIFVHSISKERVLEVIPVRIGINFKYNVFRHEKPIPGIDDKNNIKKRYYGINDPVANKMLSATKAKDITDFMETINYVIF